MAMVNPILTLANANVKDSRWLTLEVCREFQRNKCTRSDTECKFAHPPPHVEVQNGRVTACFDSIKGKCQRKDPPCKYLHPPQHLREQLLQNGRNNLILKNLQLQAAQAAFSQPIVPGLIPVTTNLVYSSSMPTLTTRARPEMYEAGAAKTTAVAYQQVLPTGQYPTLVGHPYVGTAVPTSTIAFNPYLNTAVPAGALPTAAQTNGESTMLQQQTGVIQTAIPATQAKLARPDRLEDLQAGAEKGLFLSAYQRSMYNTEGLMGRPCWTPEQTGYSHFLKPQVVEVLTGKKRPRDPADDLVLTAGIPGVYPYKRVAIADAKSGLPVYQPNANMATYQQLMQLQQQQFIPVTSVRSLHPQYLGPYFTYNHENWYVDASQVAGHPPSVPRF